MCIFEVFKTQNSGQRRKMTDFYKKSLQTMKIGVICALYEWRGNVYMETHKKRFAKIYFWGVKFLSEMLCDWNKIATFASVKIQKK